MLISNLKTHDQSPLEKTLRTNAIYKQIGLLLIQRTIWIWFFYFVVIDLLINSEFWIWFLSICALVITEMFLLKQWVLAKVLPEHQENLEKTKDLLNQVHEDPNNSYIKDFIETITANSAWSIVRLEYFCYAQELWEVLLKLCLRVLIKPCDVKFRDLFAGVSNKYTEAEQKLWELAHNLSDEHFSDRKLVMDSEEIYEYLEKYGNRANGWDLRNETFREDTESVWNTLISAPNSSKSPNDNLLELQQKSDESVKVVLENIKYMGGKKGACTRFMTWLILKTKNHTQLALDSRFYAFEFDFYIRELLFKFAGIQGVVGKEVFDYHWDALVSLRK